VNFSFPATAQARSQGKLAASNAPSLDRYVTRYPDLSGISVDLRPNGVAVLSGQTTSAENQKLAENLVRLQPGVRRVDNQTSLK
jgi:osmotically-inducible protein OsmY